MIGKNNRNHHSNGLYGYYGNYIGLNGHLFGSTGGMLSGGWEPKEQH